MISISTKFLNRSTQLSVIWVWANSWSIGTVYAYGTWLWTSQNLPTAFICLKQYISSISHQTLNMLNYPHIPCSFFFKKNVFKLHPTCPAKNKESFAWLALSQLTCSEGWKPQSVAFSFRSLPLCLPRPRLSSVGMKRIKTLCRDYAFSSMFYSNSVVCMFCASLELSVANVIYQKH